MHAIAARPLAPERGRGPVGSPTAATRSAISSRCGSSSRCSTPGCRWCGCGPRSRVLRAEVRRRDDLAGLRIVTDGVSVFACYDDGQILDALPQRPARAVRRGRPVRRRARRRRRGVHGRARGVPRPPAVGRLDATRSDGRTVDADRRRRCGRRRGRRRPVAGPAAHAGRGGGGAAPRRGVRAQRDLERLHLVQAASASSSDGSSGA